MSTESTAIYSVIMWMGLLRAIALHSVSGLHTALCRGIPLLEALQWSVRALTDTICKSEPRTISNITSLLGSFEKLQKATVSFVVSVCPSAGNNSAPTGRILMKYGISRFF